MLETDLPTIRQLIDDQKYDVALRHLWHYRRDVYEQLVEYSKSPQINSYDIYLDDFRLADEQVLKLLYQLRQDRFQSNIFGYLNMSFGIFLATVH